VSFEDVRDSSNEWRGFRSSVLLMDHTVQVNGEKEHKDPSVEGEIDKVHLFIHLKDTRKARTVVCARVADQIYTSAKRQGRIQL
jgi:hypothetical protein